MSRPYDIEQLAQFFTKGYVAMDEDGYWRFFEFKPKAIPHKGCWESKEVYDGHSISGLNIRPARDWTQSITIVGVRR